MLLLALVTTVLLGLPQKTGAALVADGNSTSFVADANSTSASAGPNGLIVDLGYSKYQGVTNGEINSWFGIRYAQPPLKELRFKGPQAPQNTSSLQPANKVWFIFSIPVIYSVSLLTHSI
jgi:hypothetical protein